MESKLFSSKSVGRFSFKSPNEIFNPALILKISSKVLSSMDDKILKEKYLKYKNKYLNLKNKESN